MLTLFAGGVLTVAFLQGSWWHSQGSDQPLGRDARARVEAVRATLVGRGDCPEAVSWLDAALDPTVDPSTARLYLLAAQQALQDVHNPDLDGAARELQFAIDAIRPTGETANTPPPPSATLWPW